MTSIDQPLQGKILLVTGGASGIGLSVTEQACELGAKVLVADLKTTPEYDTFAAGKDELLYVQSDVSKWSDFTKMFVECEKKWGDVPDAYAICAGIFEPSFSNFWQDPEEDGGYKLVAINVDHPIKLTRLAIRKSLSRGKRASVCIIASMAGLLGNIAAPLYCASKHAIVGFVKSMKDTESLTGVKVTTILPAGVATPLFDTEKMKQFSSDPELFLKPDACATHMLDMLQKKEYPCGSVSEISLSGIRQIPEWNIPPPQGPGSGQEAMSSEIIENLLQPIVKAVGKDKGTLQAWKM